MAFVARATLVVFVLALLLAYLLEPRRVEAALPDLAARFDRAIAPDHGDLAAGLVARANRAVAAAAEDIGWLLVVPILAIFFLENRAPSRQRC